jgi:hypothetical protein
MNILQIPRDDSVVPGDRNLGMALGIVGAKSKDNRGGTIETNQFSGFGVTDRTTRWKVLFLHSRDFPDGFGS